MGRGLRRENIMFEESCIRKQDEEYEKNVNELVSLIETEATIGCLESVLGEILNHDVISVKQGESIIKELIYYLRDDISYATDCE